MNNPTMVERYEAMLRESTSTYQAHINTLEARIRELEAACAAKHEALRKLDALADKYYNPIGDEYACGASDMSVRVKHAIKPALADNPGAGLLEVVEVAKRFDDCMTEFDGDESCCGECLDDLFKALAALGGGDAE